jgi:hypothetical protein
MDAATNLVPRPSNRDTWPMLMAASNFCAAAFIWIVLLRIVGTRNVLVFFSEEKRGFFIAQE